MDRPDVKALQRGIGPQTAICTRDFPNKILFLDIVAVVQSCVRLVPIVGLNICQQCANRLLWRTSRALCTQLHTPRLHPAGRDEAYGEQRDQKHQNESHDRTSLAYTRSPE